MENAFVVEQVREWLPLNLFDARQYNYLVHLHVENDIHFQIKARGMHMKIFSSFLNGYFFLKTHTRENMFLLLKNLLLSVKTKHQV